MMGGDYTPPYPSSPYEEVSYPSPRALWGGPVFWGVLSPSPNGGFPYIQEYSFGTVRTPLTKMRSRTLGRRTRPDEQGILESRN